MNKYRREKLVDVIDMLDEVCNEIDDIILEEQEAYDNLPNGLQESCTGDNMLECINLMEESKDSIYKIQSFIDKEIVKKK